MSPQSITKKTTLLVLAVAAFIAAPVPGYAAPKGKAMPMPDFTKGDTVAKDGPHDWTLGPTGARGWIYTANGHSADARQILVTEVAKGSPAAAALSAGDVIVGVDGKVFSSDARIRFANAIGVAETEKGGGRLRLLRWRAGKSEEVLVMLPVLGDYSTTAPYGCPKSKRIYELGCQSLARRMAAPDYARGLNAIPRSLNALALLASGNKEYLPSTPILPVSEPLFSPSCAPTWKSNFLAVCRQNPRGLQTRCRFRAALLRA